MLISFSGDLKMGIAFLKGSITLNLPPIKDYILTLLHAFSLPHRCIFP